MAEVTRSGSPSPLGSEFNNFLFASVGDDGTGGLLSVLSALARKNIDPWHEAAVLAGLPKEAAINRLASIIVGFLDHSSRSAEPVTVAARLIALLPRDVRPRSASPTVANSPAPHIYIMIFVLLAQLAIPYFGAAFRLGPVKGISAAHAAEVHHETSSSLVTRHGSPPN
jgi:hypothetical protein